MAIDAIKKKYPIIDENGQPSAYPTFASQVFFDDGTALDGKKFGGMTDGDLLTVYPVGSIYMSVAETSPASLFGGTWEQIEDRFLLAAGSTHGAGSTGGEAVHTLTVDEMPAHYHEQDYAAAGVNEGGTIGQRGYQTTTTVTTRKTTTTGGGQPHNNMPPYLAVYMWKRVA